MGIFHKEPEEVFQIRSATVDETVYVDREDLEKHLTRLVKAAPNIIIRGESGCGKTWLYKRVFEKENICYEIIDLSQAVNCGMTIEKVIQNKLDKDEEYIQTGYSTEKNASLKIPVAEGGLVYNEEFQKNEKPLLRMYKKLSKRGKRSVLVLDNLEQIKESEQLLSELNTMIMNVDNDDYADFGVKLLIVGTPSGFNSFYGKSKNLDTMSNRLKALEEVEGLSLPQTRKYFEKSMIKAMKFKFAESDMDKYVKHIHGITNGIPQRLVEYCLNLCYTIEDQNGCVVYSQIYKEADSKYLKETLDKSVEVIKRNLNSNETALQRRNQVIYTLGRMKNNFFKTADVEKELRKVFKIEDSVSVNVSALLTELSSGDTPIISKVGDNWMFFDSQYPVTIKLMLSKKGKKIISLV